MPPKKRKKPDEGSTSGLSKQSKKTAPVPKKRVKKTTTVEVVNDDDGGSRMSTVKCCLKGRLTEPDVTFPIIDSYVEYISRVMRHGSMFVNVFLLHVLQTHDGRIPEFLDVSDRSFFNRCMMVLGDSFDTKGNAEKSLMVQIRDQYSDLFAGVRYKRRLKDTQLINEATKLYYTNFQNHHEVHLFQRMKKYLRARIGKANWKQMSSSCRYQVTRYIWAEAQSFPMDDVLMENIEWIEELRNRYLDVQSAKRRIGEECAIFREALKNADGDDEKKLLRSGRDEVLSECTKQYWRKLVEFTYWLGNQLHAHFESEWKERPAQLYFGLKKVAKSDFPPKKGYHKVFSIAPVCDIRRQAIVLSTTTMNDIFNVPLIYRKNPIDFLFRGVDKLRSVTKGWKLQGTLRTDGVSLSVLFERPKTVVKPPPLPAEPKRLIAIDPGVINMYYGVEERPDGTQVTHKYRTKEYYHEGFVWESRNRMEAEKAGCRDVLDRLSQCVKKTVVLELQLEYWKEYVSSWKKLFECLATRKRSKLSMNVFINGNKSIDRFLMRIKGDSRREDILIAFGAAKFSSNIRGTLSVPASRAFKRCAACFRTFLVDEYNTSKYCPKCSKLLSSPKELRLCRDGVTRMFESRSVKRCTTSECLRVAEEHPLEHVRHVARDSLAYEMSRDKIGSLNILKRAVAELRGEDVPAHLCRGGHHECRANASGTNAVP
jgi:transposase